MGVFRNRDNRFRSGWKIVIVIMSYFLAQLVISMIAAIAVNAIISASNKGVLNPGQMGAAISWFLRDNYMVRIVMQVLDFAVLMLVIYLALRIFDRGRFKDIGLTKVKGGIRDLACGLLMGAVSMTVIFFTLLLTGSLTLKSSLLQPEFTPLTIAGLIAFIFVGIKEEALTRGYCISALNQMGRPWLSVIISSVIFSSLHLFNPNVKLFGLINIFLVGVLFGYMYLKSRNLWMPIGYHITWNYFQGDIFGLPVSGGGQKGIYSVSVFKDNLLTGGRFGPEAGVLATIVIILGIIFIWKMPDRMV